jgi:hypothetical protein
MSKIAPQGADALRQGLELFVRDHFWCFYKNKRI